MNVWITTAVLVAAGQVPDLRPPVALMNRLAAAARADGAAPDVASRRARLDALVQFTTRAVGRLEYGEFAATDLFNLLQVERDMVEAGAGLATVPEEALVWQRVGLGLAEAQHRLVKRKAGAAWFRAELLDQTRAQVELFRAQYEQALARCRVR